MFGAQGPQGKRGPAGKVKVTCKIKDKKVRCVVKTNSKRKGKSKRIGWWLMHGGKAYAHGRAVVNRNGHARVRLNADRLLEGRYVLRVGGQKGGIRVVLG